LVSKSILQFDCSFALDEFVFLSGCKGDGGLTAGAISSKSSKSDVGLTIFIAYTLD